LNDNNPINDHDSALDVSNIDGIDDHFISPLDIYYPKSWGILDAKMRYVLIKKQKGPIGKLNITFPIDNLSRHFSYSYFSIDNFKFLSFFKAANFIQMFQLLIEFS
jgi:hypothetical protein